MGSAAGYDFDMSAQLSDTMDSHRLVLWAERQAGKGEAVAHAMGRRYFEGARPLADHAMLREVASPNPRSSPNPNPSPSPSPSLNPSPSLTRTQARART